MYVRMYLKFIYFEREHKQGINREKGRERERKRERERERERMPGRLPTVSSEPSVGLDPTNHEIMT